jgi:hypothetical protein
MRIEVTIRELCAKFINRIQGTNPQGRVEFIDENGGGPGVR